MVSERLPGEGLEETLVFRGRTRTQPADFTILERVVDGLMVPSKGSSALESSDYVVSARWRDTPSVV